MSFHGAKIEFRIKDDEHGAWNAAIGSFPRGW